MKYCPNCGAELAPDDKFCTKCGYTIPEAKQAGTQTTVRTNATQVTQSSQESATVTAVQNYATNYFSWFATALRHPFKTDTEAPKYFGLISFLAIIILNGLSFNEITERLQKLAPKDVLDEIGIHDTTVSFWMSFILIGLAFYAAYLGVSYCFSHFASHNFDVTFLDYLNRVGLYTANIVILAIIQFVDSFMVTLTNGVTFYFLVWALQCVILLAGCILSIAPQQGAQPALDPAYSTILAMVIIDVLVFIVVDISAQALIANIMHQIQQLTSNGLF